MYPRILWELVGDPLRSAEHILGTTALMCFETHSARKVDNGKKNDQT